MISLLMGVLPTILGIISSSIPNLVQYLEKGQDYRHEAELVKLQMAAAREGLDHQLVVDSIKAIADEGKNLRDHDTVTAGVANNHFINVIRASIRPFLTIFFFIFYIGTKVAIITMMMQNNLAAQAIIDVVWDPYTNAIFGSIIGFYFGTRAFLHLSGKAKPI